MSMLRQPWIANKATVLAIAACLASCGADSGSADTASITANDGADSGLDALPQREPGVYTTGRAVSGIALPELPADLRTAAEKSGDLACGLPLLPDNANGQIIDGSQRDVTFDTRSSPEEVAAFYQAAALKKTADVATSGAAGEIKQKIAMVDMRKCDVLAISSASGGSEVIVRFSHNTK